MLDRFLGSYTSINSFCQLAARTNQRKELLGEWPPKAGYQPLVDLKFERLRALLEQEPYRVQFFQAVRLMERLYPERNPVGLFVAPSSEVVRFSSLPSLSFPASEIAGLEMPDQSKPARIQVNFMGLVRRWARCPTPIRSFCSNASRRKIRRRPSSSILFNHRIISLFHRGWQKVSLLHRV